MLLAAFAVFLAASVLYYHARFLFAGVAGLALTVLLSILLAQMFSVVTAVVLGALLLLGPAVFVAVHAVDARRGIFLLPTVYSIPLAYACAALCLIIVTAAQLL